MIEDTGGCVRDDELHVVSQMKSMVDHIFYWPQGLDAENWPFLSKFPDDADWLARHMIGIAFYRWIVFVMRGNNPRDNVFLQPPSGDAHAVHVLGGTEGSRTAARAAACRAPGRRGRC